MTPAEAAEAVKVQVQTDKERIEQQVIARYPRASNALRNAALSVLANPSPEWQFKTKLEYEWRCGMHYVRHGIRWLSGTWNKKDGSPSFCRQDTADCIAEYHGYICRDRRLTC